MRVGMISLGCAKNLVDSELVLGMLRKNGYDITTNQNEAEVVIINTCGFIQSAKQEAVDAIFDAIQNLNKDINQKIVVIGCLVERYKEILETEIPEVAGFIAIRDYDKFGEKLEEILHVKNNENQLKFENREVSTPPYWAYVKIADGCSNHCAYCAIPLIRGEFKSRKIDDIYKEVKSLVESGRKEIVLIAQDTTRFGKDNNESIEELLLKLVTIKGLEFLKLLYLYPDEISKDLIKVIKENKIIAPYFDIPMQHGSNKMLKLMNRRGSKESALELIDYIRKEIPEAVFRTTLMVGFDYESDEDIDELLDFMEKAKFDRLGAFKFSKEDETPAEKMHGDIEESVKETRYQKVIKLQERISYRQNKSRIGDINKAIIIGYDERMNKYLARSYAFAPDDVDGYLYVDSKKSLERGSIINVRITDCMIHDLIGEQID